MDKSYKPLQAVLLDAGNTILGLDYRILAETLAPNDPRVTPAAVEREECRARSVVAPLLTGKNDLSLEDSFAFFARAIAEPLGLDPAGEGPRKMISMLLTTPGMDKTWCVPMPGALETIHKLQARGLKLAVVSNGDGGAPRRLAEAGLADPFEIILDSGNVGVEKPDPRIFHMALEAIDVAPEEAVYVGDFYQVDVLGARQAGMREGILLDPFGDWGKVDCPVIPSVAELPQLLVNLGHLPPATPVDGEHLTCPPEGDKT